MADLKITRTGENEWRFEVDGQAYVARYIGADNDFWENGVEFWTAGDDPQLVTTMQESASVETIIGWFAENARLYDTGRVA